MCSNRGLARLSLGGFSMRESLPKQGAPIRRACIDDVKLLMVIVMVLRISIGVNGRELASEGSWEAR